MYLLSRLLTLFTVIALAATLGCERVGYAGGDHGSTSHGVEADTHGDERPDPISVTLFTDKVQLFMEYPQLVKGEPARFLAHLTVMETGAPIRSGSLHFKLTDAAGATQKVVVDAPKRDGLFTPEWTFDAAKTYALELLLVSPQADDRIAVGELIVHANEDAAFHAAEAAAEALAAALSTFASRSVVVAQPTVSAAASSNALTLSAGFFIVHNSYCLGNNCRRIIPQTARCRNENPCFY